MFGGLVFFHRGLILAPVQRPRLFKQWQGGDPHGRPDIVIPRGGGQGNVCLLMTTAKQATQPPSRRPRTCAPKKRASPALTALLEDRAPHTDQAWLCGCRRMLPASSRAFENTDKPGESETRSWRSLNQAKRHLFLS